MVDLADRQHGVVTRPQLLELGFSRREVQGRVEAGWLRPVHRGVYAVGRARLARHGLWMAAVLACGDDALLSHRSAAELWRLVDPIAGPVHVSVGRGGRRERRGIIAHRTNRLVADRRRHEGIPATSVEHTLLDLAATGSPSGLKRAFDRATHRELLDPTIFTALLDRSGGRRGSGRLRELLAAHHPLPDTRSELERRFLRLVRDAEIAAPAVDVPLLGYEVDCLWPRQRLVVELDSFEHHRDRATFEADRERDVALGLAGYRVLRFTHRRIEAHPAAVIAALRRALALRSTA